MSTPVNFSGLILLTGLPGSGKSLRMVSYMMQALELGRPVYVCNMPSCKLPGIQILENPHDWRELPPEAVLFVDEAQRFFRARRGNVEPPESITAMETIRHDGVCIVMTTQQPTYLDKHIRGLIGRHEHLIRNFGHESANIYEFRECYDDVQSPSLRDNAQFSVWLYPKKVYAAYESAEVHTVKARIPRKLLIGAACAVAALALGAYSFSGLFGLADPSKSSQPAAPAAGGLTASAGAPERNRVHYRTAEELARWLKPRIAELPWSAPAFDEGDVVSKPEVYCMSSDVSCTCLTEQGTRYDVERAQCLDMARHGPAYNPFREPPVPGRYEAPQRGERVATSNVPAGARSEPGDVGHPEQGKVWGKAPETVRAEWSPGF